MRRFENRTAFVTGAAHGIGRAIAERFMSEGANVVVADLDVEAAATIGDGQKTLAVACDITDRASVEAAISEAVKTFGGIDVLVNNAGRGSGIPFAETDDDSWSKDLELNLVGAVRCVQAAIPALLNSPFGGNVVAIGSVNGIAAFGDIAYSTAKAGLNNLVKNLTAMYAPKGLRFNVVAPGTIRTRVWAGREENLEQFARELYPLGRVGEPEDIAAAVAFLASDDAAWISGVVLPVDGGVLSGPIARSFIAKADQPGS